MSYGILSSVPITREKTRVKLHSNKDGTMTENQLSTITWEKGLLGSESEKVTVEMARYEMERDQLQFHSFYPLVASQFNNGKSQFRVQNSEGVGYVLLP